MSYYKQYQKRSRFKVLDGYGNPLPKTFTSRSDANNYTFMIGRPELRVIEI